MFQSFLASSQSLEKIIYIYFVYTWNLCSINKKGLRKRVGDYLAKGLPDDGA